MFFTSLREIIGKKEALLEFTNKENVTINMALEVLSERYGTPFSEYVYDPNTHNVKGFLQFLINGKSISQFNKMQTKLSDNDVLAILPPVGGG